ncbi:PRTRC system protein C [Arsenicibacter rosenii]|uniref:PRTRC system protein C n=1 Tax=Arsenicibacter rosenii TaxID=1750698 RepID=A0A1S2VAY1_9BACT|nr:PRTRC system protein C [Arsenicibacter rosenii]OIN55852.1 PRTRC system protein C [Arsenicibacter rosenii]
MLLATKLDRVFVMKTKGKDITLEDPNPELSPEAVMNHYSHHYPELITAKLEGPEIKEDKFEYRFTSVMGTKG